MRTVRFLVLLSFLFTVNYTFSQTAWSLKRCVEFAYENNVQMKQSAFSVKIQEYNLAQSKAALLPSLNAGADYNMNFGRSVDPYTYEFTTQNIQSSNLYVSAQMNLFSGGKNFNTIRRNNYNLMASIQEQAKLKDDLAMNIATVFLQILFNQEILKTSENRLLQSKDQEDFTKKLVNAGKLPEGDLLNMTAQTANSELQVINARNQLKNTVLLLQQLIDYTDTTAFEIELPVISAADTILPYTIDEVYQTALTMPEIVSQEYRLKASSYEVSIARSNFYPKLSLSASYSTGYSDARKQYAPGDTLALPVGYTDTYQTVYMFQPTFTESAYPFVNQFADNAGTSVGLRLSVPIFNNRMTETAVKTAKIQSLNQELNVYNAKNTLFKTISEAFGNADAALQRYRASERAMLANKTAYEYSEKKYKVGLISYHDFQLTFNNFQNAESEHIQAKFDYLFRRSILDYYAGKGFSF